MSIKELLGPNPIIRDWELLFGKDVADEQRQELTLRFNEFCADSRRPQLFIPEDCNFMLRGMVVHSRASRVESPGKCTVSQIRKIDRLTIGDDGHDFLVATTRSGCLYSFYADRAK